jgi:sulfate permease, SulP family
MALEGEPRGDMASTDVTEAGPSEAPAAQDQPMMARFLPVLTSGVVIGVVEVVLASSFGALVFSGRLSGSVASGIGLALFGALATQVSIAVFSSLRGMVGSTQDISAAVLALMAASIAARVASPSTAFATVVVAIGMTSVVTGAFFVGLGAFRLGELVRFVPYPVVGGFLAGTGWLLVKGGIGVLAGRSLTFHTLGDFAKGSVAAKWVAGLAFAVLLLLLTRRMQHLLLIPALLVGGLVAFYAIAPVAAHGIGQLKHEGWLLGDLPRSALWRPWSVTRFGDVDWSAIASQIPNIATIVILSALALLLNASGIELAVGRDLDLNRELVAAGAANLVAGSGGGMVGFHALSLTALADKMGARSRLVGVITGSICTLALLFGASTLSLFPRPILGGVIVFLGLGFLVEWVYDAWFRLPQADHAVVLLILIVIATFGFLPGVGVGIAVAIVLFVVNYSRTDVVKHSLSGAEYQSRTERSPQQSDALRERRGEIWILELQGFVFFGTASRLVDRIRYRAASLEGALRFLVLDFRRVIGVDSSAMLSFAKILTLAEKNDFPVLFTAASPNIRSQLERVGFREAEGKIMFLPDLDRAVQWCEDRILSLASLGQSGPGDSIWVYLLAGLGPLNADRLMAYLRRLEFAEGDFLIQQGEAARDVYLLEAGRVTATVTTPRGETVRLRSMGPGTVVGEMAPYLRNIRTASVVAETSVTVYRLSEEAFEEMEEQDPQLAAALHRMFATLIAQRLADTLDTVRALSD